MAVQQIGELLIDILQRLQVLEAIRGRGYFHDYTLTEGSLINSSLTLKFQLLMTAHLFC